MKLAVVAAGFTPGEADQLRRAMGAWRKTGVIEKFQDKLMRGMKANGLNEEFADQVFRQIRGFGEYGFPESHAASFALLVYVSAWLKYYYPAAFTASVLNSLPMGFYAPAQLVADARRHGVEVRPVDVNFSNWDNKLEARRAGREERQESRGKSNELKRPPLTPALSPPSLFPKVEREHGVGASEIVDDDSSASPRASYLDSQASRTGATTGSSSSAAEEHCLASKQWHPTSDTSQSTGAMSRQRVDMNVDSIDNPGATAGSSSRAAEEHCLASKQWHPTSDTSQSTGAMSRQRVDMNVDSIDNPGATAGPSSSAAEEHCLASKQWHPTSDTSQSMGAMSRQRVDMNAVTITNPATQHAHASTNGGSAFQASSLAPQNSNLPPHPHASPLPQPAIRLGFRQISGMREDASEKISAARADGLFVSLADFAQRTGLGQGIIERLSKADAFASLKQDRRVALWQALGQEKKSVEQPLFDSMTDDDDDALLPMLSDQEHVFSDYRAVGLSLRNHPIAFYRDQLEALKVVAAADLAHKPDEKHLRVAGLVILRQRPSTAKGITFVTLEDETGTSNLVVKQPIWQRYYKTVRTSPAWIAHGKLERKSGVIHVVVNRIEDLSEKLTDLNTKSRDFR
jgi:DNA polymerase III alpha subunit